MAGETLGSVALTVGFAVVGILAAQLAGSTGAVGLTQASQTVGAAAASYVIASWMNRQGRRRGLSTGYAVGALGAGLCVLAAVTGSFALLVAGSVALGSASASSSLSRYAATDLAPPGRRATALSLVVWTATAGSVAGPLLVPAAEGWAGWLGLPPLAGPFLLAMLSTGVAAILLFVFLRPDPLLLARTSAARAEPADDTAAPVAAPPPPLRVLAPVVVTLVATHCTMVAVMVMTPVAMHHGGASHHAIGAAISVHFLGMYAFAPLSGMLADRIGVRPALGIGGGILLFAVAMLAGLFGDVPGAHAIGMFALGLGWSVNSVAASARIAALSVGDTRIQGFTETSMAVASAVAAAAAGAIVALWGFDGLTTLAGAFTVVALIATTRIRTAIHVSVSSTERNAS